MHPDPAPIHAADALSRQAAGCPAWQRVGSALRRWFVTDSTEADQDVAGDRIDWLGAAPFVAMHIACVAVLWVGLSPVALAVAGALYVVRMFAITGFYHRYFSHRTFRTSRAVQFAFALIGASCVQRGPLWWAAHHRHHHRHTDTALDPHSPTAHGFLWSHVGWFLTRNGFRTDPTRVPDLMRYPELAAEPGRAARGDDRGADAGLRQRRRRAVVPALADVLDGLRRDVRLRRRAGVAGRALPLRQFMIFHPTGASKCRFECFSWPDWR